jgi:hypothetical protein
MKKAEQTEQLKKALIIALEKSLGIVTTACKEVGVGRTTYYEWYKNDLTFKSQVDDVSEISLDYAESSLFKQIENGNTSATIFYLKTKGKKRGYIERQELVQRVDIEQELQELSNEQLQERLNELRSAVQN